MAMMITTTMIIMMMAVGREDSCDCYVNLADQDVLVIGREIANTLGGVYKLKLCFRAEDVTSHPRTHELSSSTFLNRWE